MIRICLLATKPQITDKLISFSDNTSIEFLQFDKNKKGVNYQKFTAVLLVEPCECFADDQSRGDYTSIYKIWKQYLERHSPSTKLLVAGFQDVEHPNFIPLLQLWEDFDWKSTVQQALNVTEDWGENFPQNGICLLEKFQLFFKGHNNEGIIDTLAAVRQSLNNAYVTFAGSTQLNIEPQPFPQIWQDTLYPRKEHIRTLNARWESYKLYFNLLPFYSLLSELKVDTFIAELNRFFRGKQKLSPKQFQNKEIAFKQLDGYNRLGQLVSVLESINKSYITIENIGNVLLIDDDSDFHQLMKKSFPSYHFFSAFTPKEAEQQLKTKEINLILLDLEISPNNLEGIDLIPELRQQNPQVPIAIVSTYGSVNIIPQVINLGANHFLHKTHFDIVNWNRVFTGLMYKKRYSLAEIIHANEFITNDKHNVLFIEDQVEEHAKVKNISAKYNYEFATTIQQATDRLKEKKFDLILLDLYFEIEGKEENIGIHFIEEIKLINPTTPVIVIIKDGSLRTITTALEKGASYFLQKNQFNAIIWATAFDLFIKANHCKDE